MKKMFRDRCRERPAAVSEAGVAEGGSRNRNADFQSALGQDPRRKPTGSRRANRLMVPMHVLKKTGLVGQGMTVQARGIFRISTTQDYVGKSAQAVLTRTENCWAFKEQTSQIARNSWRNPRIVIHAVRGMSTPRRKVSFPVIGRISTILTAWRQPATNPLTAAWRPVFSP